MAIRLLLCDDHEMVREGLRALLSEEGEIDIVSEAADGQIAVRLAQELRPDVVLMDLRMPELDGIAATRAIRTTCPGTHVVVLTTFLDERQVRDAIHAGACGYLLKDVLKDELIEAIRAASEGRPSLHPEAQAMLMRQRGEDDLFALLTPRETDVLRLVAAGRSNKEIGQELRLTEGTVKGYVSSVFVKLRVDDRTQAALLAVKHGL